MNDTIQIAAQADSDWPITNCYIDAWMLILAAQGLDPLAGLGVIAAQDYEADQFTFFKYQHDDLELLYGLVVGELTIYRSMEQQIDTQVRQGRLVLLEVDGYYLPDTRATSYLRQHTKTTIGIDNIDLERGVLGYFHNVGHYELRDADYAGIFRKLPQQMQVKDVLPAYVEFVKRRFAPLSGAALADAARNTLRRHLRRRPADNPIQRYREDFPHHIERLLTEPDAFHDYAFGIFRQLGSNHQLLAWHLAWLEAQGMSGLGAAIDAARTISATAKSMQFKVARIASRRQFDPCDAMFGTLERSYAAVGDSLQQALG